MISFRDLLKKKNSQKHWEKTYANTSANQVGWFAPHLQTSLSWIKSLELSNQAPIIDVGGGASTLADDLLEKGYQKLTILDLSATALATTKSTKSSTFLGL